MENLNKILRGEADNHLLPFLWVHGQDEATYRKMVRVIHEANMGAFCVEARPHPQFCKQQWWADMIVLLDEAEKRGMKVWILDDKHFPTGFAAGAVRQAPPRLKRRHMTHKRIPVTPGQTVHLNIQKQIKPRDGMGVVGLALQLYTYRGRPPKRLRMDEPLVCVACGEHGSIDLMDKIKNGKLTWTVPNGVTSVELCGLTYDSGLHRDYINMLDPESCRLLIDAVYEPHYTHFSDKFGSTIAGFFSDEPELGNGNYLNFNNLLGTVQSLPYSAPLAQRLVETLGADWKQLLPLLWVNDGDPADTARMRAIYMDCVTRLVEESFSKQIGEWCRAHGVEYIGHVIEDNNQHARTSTSLGHYFRGLKWQSMAGIDDIGGQVYPGGEDKHEKSIIGMVGDGEFYHYALGKLGVGLGTLNPHMQGRTMCEIFGNYGWQEGLRLEKYLLDHFLVRGVNYFVPHAFTCKPYPDPDCPPHFYAQGNNPQYRHFGCLMAYANRICNLISHGSLVADVAILYHGEAEWAGNAMLMQKPARALYDAQIDFCFVPGDVFAERDFYRTEITGQLAVNGMPFRLLVVPYAQYLPDVVVQGIAELLEKGGRVVFLDALPDGTATGKPLPPALHAADVLPLAQLAGFAKAQGLQDVEIAPANNRLRVLHYRGESELFFLVNEGADTWRGEVSLPTDGPVCGFDAWRNQLYAVETSPTKGRQVATIEIDGYSSMILLVNRAGLPATAPLRPAGNKTPLTTFTQSTCRAIDYPNFSKPRAITELRGFEETRPKFSGFIRYETSIDCAAGQTTVLEITDAYEGVEVFVNGASARIQITPHMLFDLTPLCVPGPNLLAIEVATTLARERGKRQGHTGLCGQVNLYTNG